MRIFLLLVLLIIFGKVGAQSVLKTDTAQLLKEISISYEASKLHPVSFTNIYGRELKSKSTGQEPSFLLSETPSITAYSDAGNTQGYSYFRIRGIDQTRINITMDGVPLNEPEDQGAYFSNYPDILNSVNSMQIQRGIGTSKNGSASYGGSVQLFSPTLRDSAQTTVGVGYGSFNSWRAFAEYNSGIKNRKALYVRVSQIGSDGYKYNSGNHSKSIFVSSGLFNKKATWKMTMAAGDQANELAWLGVSDSLIKADKRTNGNTDEHDKFTQGLLQFQNLWHPNNSSNLQSSIYSTFLKGNYDFNLNSFLGLPGTNELYNYAFQSNLLGFFSNYRLSGKSFNLITGMHANTYNRRHIGSEKSIGQLYTNTGYKNEWSAFSKLNFTVKNFTLFSDIQYRYTEFSYRGDVLLNTLKWRFLNPKAGLTYKVKNQSLLYYSIGKTGREPTRNDIFGGNDNLLSDDAGNALIFAKNSEMVINQELGFRHQTQKLTFDLNLYYMNFKNEIVLDGKLGPNGLNLTNNVDESYRRGVELSLKYTINSNLTLNNNSSLNHSRIKEQGEVFQPVLTPFLILNQEVVWSNKRFLIGLSARYQSQSYIDFANSESVKNYCFLNSRVQYHIRRVELSCFAYNITNTTYFNNGYVDSDGSRKLFVQAPANFYTALKYSF